MIYHIGGVNIYMERFVRFLRQNKAQLEGKHYYVFYGNKRRENLDIDDCKYVTNLWALLKFFLFSKREDRFILHSYMYPWLYLSCFLTPWNSKKILWIIWGGDLYFYKEEKNFKYKCYEFLRRHTISRFRYVMGVEGDFILAQQYYRVRGEHLNGIYPLEFINASVDESVLEVGSTINILVGNSADPSNNHIESLLLLKRFASENIHIYLPLSYNGTPDYIRHVDNVGQEIFGDKYSAIKYFMNASEYNKFLSDMDIFICNHNRQQALGNIFALLKMGKKIFLKKGISTDSLLKSHDLKFFYTQDITDLKFDDFLFFDEKDKQMNQKIVTNLYSSTHLVVVWNLVFRKILQ